MDQRDRFVEASPYTRPVDRKKLCFIYDQLTVHALREGHRLEEESVLDLGSAAGALTIPLASVVGKVDAVDLDPEGLSKLNERVKEDGLANVAVFKADATTF